MIGVCVVCQSKVLLNDAITSLIGPKTCYCSYNCFISCTKGGAGSESVDTSSQDGAKVTSRLQLIENITTKSKGTSQLVYVQNPNMDGTCWEALKHAPCFDDELMASSSSRFQAMMIAEQGDVRIASENCQVCMKLMCIDNAVATYDGQKDFFCSYKCLQYCIENAAKDSAKGHTDINLQDGAHAMIKTDFIGALTVVDGTRVGAQNTIMAPSCNSLKDVKINKIQAGSPEDKDKEKHCDAEIVDGKGEMLLKYDEFTKLF